MVQDIFVCCKNSHSNDDVFLHKLERLDNVVEVHDTHVRDDNGKEYCKHLEVSGNKNVVAKVATLLRSHRDVGRVWVPDDTKHRS